MEFISCLNRLEGSEWTSNDAGRTSAVVKFNSKSTSLDLFGPGAVPVPSSEKIICILILCKQKTRHRNLKNTAAILEHENVISA